MNKTVSQTQAVQACLYQRGLCRCRPILACANRKVVTHRVNCSDFKENLEYSISKRLKEGHALEYDQASAAAEESFQ